MTWDCDIISQYNKFTEFLRDNYVENSSTEVSMAVYSELVKEGSVHYDFVCLVRKYVRRVLSVTWM